MQLNNLDLIKEFISSCSNFWNEDFSKVDKKHQYILNKFQTIYQNNLEQFSEKIIDWEAHSDLSAPFQITKYHLKNQKIKLIILNILREIKKNLTSRQFDKSSFFDDVDILKKTNAYNLLKEFPAHRSNLRENIYFIEKGVSANSRWVRYIYIANKILNEKILRDNSIWIDIGSYYGGLQSIVKSKIKKTKIFLVDFNHQLCRSYVYLKNLYPESRHVLPDEFSLIKNYTEIESDSIVYVKVGDFNKLNGIKADLITNFVSFGEMKRDTFNKYFNSEIINNCSRLYLINRFVSSPFFETTYDSNLNIFDYLKNNFSREYFDVFPINHYYKHPRKIFNRFAKRPMSCPYFEMILKNKYLK